VVDHGSRSTGQIIAVGGGKGGVGKTVVSANLAVELARRGRRVLVVDGDLGGANLHTVLGVQPPKATLSDVLFHGAKLVEVVTPTKFANLSLVSGAFDEPSVANPKHQEKMRLIRHLHDVDYDVLLIDLGAGTAFNTLDLFLLADDGVLVVVPEPTSVENAYRFLKAAFLRRMKAIERGLGANDVIADAVARNGSRALKSPLDLLRVIAAHDPELGAEIGRQLQHFTPRLILNQVHDDESGEERGVADDMASASRRFFGIQLHILGILPEDPEVRRALRARTPVVHSAPTSRFSVELTKIGERITSSMWRAGQAA
jgi:flagellar biosynthesis protein FlhG